MILDELARLPFIKEGLAIVFLGFIAARTLAARSASARAAVWLQGERDAIRRAQDTVETNDCLEIVTVQTRSGASWAADAVESVARRTNGDLNNVRLDDLVARLETQAAEQSAAPRAFGGTAVYVGLVGTLLGLTIAVFQLTRTSESAEAIKEHILNVVGGFALTFLSALAGVLATLVLAACNEAYERSAAQALGEAEALLYDYVLPTLAGDREKARSDAAERAKREMQALAEGLKEASQTVKAAAATITASATLQDKSFEEVRRSTSALETSAKNLVTATEGLGPLKDAIASAQKSLADIDRASLKHADGLNEGANALAEQLKKTGPANESLKKAATLLENMDRTLGHSIAKLGETYDSKLELVAKAIADAEAKHGALAASVADALEKHQQFVEKVEGHLQDMPLEVPLERLNRQAEAAQGQLDQQLRDSARTTESMKGYLGQIEKLGKKLDEMEKTAARVQSTMIAASSAANEHIEDGKRAILIKVPWIHTKGKD